jgi:hypothetical protein
MTPVKGYRVEPIGESNRGIRWRVVRLADGG